MHVLANNVQRVYKSFALELDKSVVDGEARMFYTAGHKVHFVDMDIATFAAELGTRMPRDVNGVSTTVAEPSGNGTTETAIPEPVLDPGAPTVFVCHAHEDAAVAASLVCRTVWPCAFWSVAFTAALATLDRTKCTSNLRQVGVAIGSYVADNNGDLPGPLWVWQNPYYHSSDYGVLGTVLAKYLGLTILADNQTALANVLMCPTWKRGFPYVQDEQFIMNSEVGPNKINPWGDARVVEDNGGVQGVDPLGGDRPHPLGRRRHRPVQPDAPERTGDRRQSPRGEPAGAGHPDTMRLQPGPSPRRPSAGKWASHPSPYP
jgi:hypothetical protein